MLFPLTMFCCGCRVVTGAYIILACNLVISTLTVAFTISNLIFVAPTITAEQDPVQQLYATGWSLIGIPLIISAIFGVYNRVEIHVRLYLYYLLCSFFISIVWFFVAFMFVDPCDRETSGNVFDAMGNSFGEAFMCGIMRIFVYLFVAFAITTEAYFIWSIWSWCEDVKCGLELSELLPTKDDVVRKQRRPDDGPYADIVGIAHAKVPGPYPFAFSTSATAGMPGQPTLFNGSVHDTNCPPSQHAAAF